VRLTVNLTDLIQLGLLMVNLGTLVVVGLSLRSQVRIQQASLTRDRFDMYRWTYKPITEDDIKDFRINPRSYLAVSDDLSDDQIRQLIDASRTYEFLAFSYKLRSLGLLDRSEKRWLNRWVQELATDKAFQRIHEAYGDYYEYFKDYVDRLRNRSAD
jgi:hypothetical protein